MLLLISMKFVWNFSWDGTWGLASAFSVSDSYSRIWDSGFKGSYPII